MADDGGIPLATLRLQQSTALPARPAPTAAPTHGPDVSEATPTDGAALTDESAAGLAKQPEQPHQKSTADQPDMKAAATPGAPPFYEGVRPPNTRHDATKVTQKSTVRDVNTVYGKDVDVKGDVEGIRKGQATEGRRPNGERSFTLNGRTYGAHPDGRLYPVEGKGFHVLDRQQYKALGDYNQFGEEKGGQFVQRRGLSPDSRKAPLEVHRLTQGQPAPTPAEPAGDPAPPAQETVKPSEPRAPKASPPDVKAPLSESPITPGKLVGKGLKIAGKIALPLTIATGVIELAGSTDKPRTAAGLAGSIAGRIAGAEGGAIIGAAIGSVVPIVGTVIGGVAGGLIGGIAGSMVGSGVADWLYGKLVG